MNTRDKIIEAALKISTNQKIANITVRAIAKEANITEGAIYKYFRSKEQLFVMIYKNGLSSLETTLFFALESEGSIENKIQSTVADFFKFYKGNKNLCYYLILNEHSFWQEKVLENTKTPIDLFTIFFKGKVKEGLELLIASQIMGVVSQIIKSNIYRDITLTPDVIHFTAEVCVGIYSQGAESRSQN